MIQGTSSSVGKSIFASALCRIFTLVADFYGMGINKFLLSKGSSVRVLEAKSLVYELKEEIAKMNDFYNNN